MAYPVPPKLRTFWPESPVSISEALAYAQGLFARTIGLGLIYHGSVKGPDNTRDVLFMWEGHRYRLTCWREENGQIYGEW